MSAAVYLLKGSDPVLLADAALALIDEVIGDADRSQVLEELSGDEYDLGAAVMAANTVSMFGERVVVARNLARFTAAQLGPLIDHLGSAPPDSTLILVWDKPTSPSLRANPVPKKLIDAVKAGGGQVIDTSPPSRPSDRGAWLEDQLANASVGLAPDARKLISERLGDDLGRLGEVLTVLDGAFGEHGRTLHAEDVEPYLGDQGGVPPWELTDAIDRGDVAGAVTNVRRMVLGGGRHPLQVMVTLQTHVERMVRLDGSGARTEKEAAALLHIKGSSFPAKKALAQSQTMGRAKLARALHLLARADVDLRGRTGQSGEQVLEVLVARLAALSAKAARHR